MLALKVFHIIFIVFSTLLSFFLGIWCLNSHLTNPNPMHALLGLLGILMSIGLVVYGVYFLQKMKKAGL